VLASPSSRKHGLPSPFSTLWKPAVSTGKREEGREERREEKEEEEEEEEEGEEEHLPT